MKTYTIKGQPATREQAVAHWHRSRTYRMAARRNLIFLMADQGDNSKGAVTHLREAGIEIIDTTDDVSGDSP